MSGQPDVERSSRGPPSLPVEARLASVVLGSEATDEEQCTLFPPLPLETERYTAWMTASGDSFVDLDHCR